MSVDLNAGVAVITGSASGIGLGMARACLDRNMRVLLSDIDETRLAETVGALEADGGAVAGKPADVRRFDDVAALRDEALNRFGQVDLICNNAGLGFTRPLTETTPSDWDLVLDVNVKGVANGVHAFLPAFLEQNRGHIGATSSLSGIVADPGLSVYNASKFAVVGLMEALALELLDTNVSASVLCPGPVATNLIHSSAEHSGVDANQEVHDYLNRGMHPDEVGEIAIAGIESGLFWLLPHPELSHRLATGRVQAMVDGGNLYVDEVDWTDQ